MSDKTQTCAACDSPLDDGRFPVRIGGVVVEVCCDDCARKLREAGGDAVSAQS